MMSLGRPAGQRPTMGTSICPYCAVGCARLVYARDNKLIHVEGDPRSRSGGMVVA